jgi:acyl dehydratase
MTETGSKEISLQELTQKLGSVIATSAWYAIDQPMIDRFAAITYDNYFIHVDPERAKTDGPYGGTIAHGMLILSLLSDMAARSLPTLQGLTSAVNYGFDKVRFVTPVRSGSRVRAHFELGAVDHRAAAQIRLCYRVKIEIEGKTRHALIADWWSLIFIGPGDTPEHSGKL